MFMLRGASTFQAQKGGSYYRYLHRILNKLSSTSPAENLFSVLNRDTQTYLKQPELL